MISKDRLRVWAINKWWSDRGASVGAYMDAMDSFCSKKGMTEKDQRDSEILHDEFWADGGLDMAYEEYRERNDWELSHIGTALHLYERFDLNLACSYLSRIENENYHRFGRDLIERFSRRIHKVDKS